MKRVCSLVLVMALILTLTVPAYADESEGAGLQNAVLLVKSVINIPKELTEFSSSVNKEEIDGKQVVVWNLNWEEKEGKENLSAAVDDKGNLTHLYSYKDEKREGLGTVNREAAFKTALAFLKKAMPTMAQDLKEVSIPKSGSTSDTHEYQFLLYKNQVPVSFARVSINIDKYTGEVASFNGLAPGTVIPALPDKEGIITQAEAKKAYFEQFGMDLNYYSTYDYKNKKRTAFAAYEPFSQGRQWVIDAKSGKAIELYESSRYYREDQSNKAMDGAGAKEASGLSEKEQEIVNQVSNLLTKEEAVSALQKAFPDLSATEKMNARLSEIDTEEGSYLWNFSFENGRGSVDAKTGQVLSYYKYDRGTERSGVGLSEEAAQKKAEILLSALAKEQFEMTTLTKSRIPAAVPYSMEERESLPYTFTYQRQANGIDFMDNSLQVSIDSVSGKVMMYRCDWYETIDFPSIKEAMSAEAVFQKFTEKADFALAYNKTGEDQLTLVYGFNEPCYWLMNAANGSPITWEGKPYKEKTMSAYTDIKGHWSEKTVHSLLENGYCLEGDRFLPDQAITQIEFFRYLYSSGYRSEQEDEEFYQGLMESGFVKAEEKNPKSVLTRQDAAKFLARYLDLSKVGEQVQIFAKVFPDRIDKEYQGYVALCKGLGIMTGDEKGRFNGKAKLTRGEAAAAIYQTLQVR